MAIMLDTPIFLLPYLFGITTATMSDAVLVSFVLIVGTLFQMAVGAGIGFMIDRVWTKSRK